MLGAESVGSELGDADGMDVVGVVDGRVVGDCVGAIVGEVVEQHVVLQNACISALPQRWVNVSQIEVDMTSGNSGYPVCTQAVLVGVALG